MAAAAARRIPRVDASAAAKARAEHLRKRTRDNLARNMMAARAAMSLTQRQLSELTGVSQTYISQAEQAKRNLSLDIVALLASFLGKTVAELVSD